MAAPRIVTLLQDGFLTTRTPLRQAEPARSHAVIGGLAVNAEGEVALRTNTHRSVAIDHRWALALQSGSWEGLGRFQVLVWQEIISMMAHLLTFERVCLNFLMFLPEF